MQVTTRNIIDAVKHAFMTKKGNNVISGHITYTDPGVYDIGSSANPLRAIYADNLYGTIESPDELVATRATGTPGYLEDVLNFSSAFTVSVDDDKMSIGRAGEMWTRMLFVDQGGKGDYTTIKDACDYVATQSPGALSQWTILVAPGTYTESAFTIPTYTVVRGMGQTPLGHAAECVSISNASATGGQYITLSTASSIDNCGITVATDAGATADVYALYSTSGARVHNCYITITSSTTSYQTYALYGLFFIAHSTISNTGNYGTSAYFTDGSQIRFCNLTSRSSLGTANYGVVNESGSTSIFHTRFGSAAGDFFNTTINVTGGTVYINNTPYKTSSGSIIHIDRIYTTGSGLRESASATDTPLTIKQASGQSNPLVTLSDSAGSSLGNIFESTGKANFKTAGMKSPWTRSVVVDQGGKGDYTTIKDACDYVATQSPSGSTPWIIYVTPGTYTESQFSIPNYTRLLNLGSDPSLTYSGPTYIRNAALEAGNFITLGLLSSIEGFGIWGTIAAGVVGDVKGIYTALGTISNCNIVISGGTSSAQAVCIEGGAFIHSCVLTSGSNYATGAKLAGGQIKFSYIQSRSSSGTANYGIVNTSGSTSVFHCRLGTTTGDFFNTSIDVTGGTVYINNTPYKTSSGTIVHIDRFYTSLSGVREAALATDIPLLIRGATSQSAYLTRWEDSSSTLKGYFTVDGDAWAARDVTSGRSLIANVDLDVTGDGYIRDVLYTNTIQAIPGGAGNLTISPSGKLILDPTGVIEHPNAQESRTVSFSDLVTGIAGFRMWDAGSNTRWLANYGAKFDELHVRVFVADETRVDRGAEYWSKSYGIVETEFETPADEATVDVWFEDSAGLEDANLFTPLDWLMLRYIDWSTGLTVFLQWYQVVEKLDDDTGTDGTPRQKWTIRRKAGGSTGVKVKKGSLLLDVGQSGQGWIHLSALSTDGGPFIQMGNWATDPSVPSNFKMFVRMGHLDGFGGYSAGSWGFAAAKDGSIAVGSGYEGFVVDKDVGASLYNTGINLYNGTDKTIELTSSGNVKFGEDVSAAATTGLTFTASSGDLLLGDSSGANILWDNSEGIFNFREGSNIRAYVDTSGTIVFGSGGQWLDEDGMAIEAPRYTSTLPGTPNNRQGTRWIDDGDRVTSRVVGWYSAATSGALPSYGNISLESYHYAIPDDTLVNTVILQVDAVNSRIYSTDGFYNDDSNITSYLGRAAIGYGGGYSDYAYFGHRDLVGSANQYAIIQDSSGQTYVNSKSGYPLNFIGDDIKIKADSIIVDSSITTFTIGEATKPIDMLYVTQIGTEAVPIETIYVTEALSVGEISGSTWSHTDDMAIEANKAATTTLFIRNTNGSNVTNVDIDGSINIGGLVDGVDVAGLQARTMTAGDGLTGGGDLSASLTFAVGAGTLITVGENTVGITTGATYQFIGTGAGTNAAWRNVSELAGAGLTASSGVLAVGAGTLLTVAADSVGITTGANYQFIGTGSGTSASWVNLSTLAGAGLTHTTGVLAVGAGTMITVAADAVGVTDGANYQFIGTGGTTSAGWRNVSELAGAGLTAANGILAVGAGTLLTVAADTVGITTGSTYQFIGTGSGTSASWINMSTLAGNGLSHSAGVLTVGAGTLITVGTTTVGITNGTSYQFIGTGSGTSATWVNMSTLAGDGLTHGAGVLAVGAGTLITVAADTVGITTGANYQFIGTGSGTSAGWRNVSELAGAGLTAATGILAVGAGNGITVNANDVEVNQAYSFTWSGRHIFTLYRAQFTGNTSPTSNFGLEIGLFDAGTTYILSYDRGGSAYMPLKIRGGTSITLDISASTILTVASGTVFLDADLQFVGAQSINTSSSTLTIAPASNLILDPDSNIVSVADSVSLQAHDYASQVTGWRITEPGAADFRYIFTDELHAKVFIADLEQALAGGQIISKSVAVISRAFTVPSAGLSDTLYVWDLPSAENMAVFQSGDIVRLRTFSRAGGSLTITDCWGVVTSYSNLANKEQSWTFTRSAAPNAGAMAGGTVIAADSLALDYGTTGNGFYEVNAIDGLYAANSPYSQIVNWTTHPATGQTVRTRTGNLYGLFSQANEYGVYAGDGVSLSNKYLRLSSYTSELHNLDIKMYDGSTQAIQIDSTDGISIVLGSNDINALQWVDSIGGSVKASLQAYSFSYSGIGGTVNATQLSATSRALNSTYASRFYAAALTSTGTANAYIELLADEDATVPGYARISASDRLYLMLDDSSAGFTIGVFSGQITTYGILTADLGTGSTATYFDASDALGLSFRDDSNTLGIHIADGGNVGIKTSSLQAGYELTVSGDVYVSGTIYAATRFDALEIRASNVAGVTIRDDSGTLGIYVADGGNVGIRTTSLASTYELTISGDTYIDGNITSIGTIYTTTNIWAVQQISTDLGFYGYASDTISAPSFTWNGDTNTGMYRPGADQVGFTTAGVSRVTIGATGIANFVVGITSAYVDTDDIWDDTNTAVNIARARVGYGGGYSDYAYFGHRDLAGTAGNYSVLQSNAGATLINTADGTTGYIRVNNTTIASWTDTGISLASGKNLSLAGAGIFSSTDGDYAHTLGRASIGYDGTNSDSASFSHRDRVGANSVALRQGQAGNVMVNAVAGQIGILAINGVEVMQWDANGIEVDPAYRVGTTFTDLTYGTGWETYSVGTQWPASYKRFGDLVFLRGTIYRSSGSGTTIATGLPIPSRVINFGVRMTGNTMGYITVDATTGNLTMVSGDPSGMVNLDGLWYAI